MLFQVLQDSQAYFDNLLKALLPFAAGNFGETTTSVFQQDGAFIHRSTCSLSWLRFNFLSKLDWPAESPYLKIIENAWGLMARRMSYRHRQFETVDEFKAAIIEVW